VGDDGVVLTDRERQALAGLAESIGDPWLARQLTGHDAAPPPKKRRFAGFAAAVGRATAGWVGLLLVVGGAILALVAFTTSTLVASLGLALMGFGAWRLAAEHGDELKNRWTARQSQTAAVPQPPRTPPAAA
jgi:hypothetical protein